MSGPPLAEAVRRARHIVDQLQATDSAALVVFDDCVQTLVPARPVGDRQALHLALSQVHSSGSTNLHGGWQTPTASCSTPARQRWRAPSCSPTATPVSARSPTLPRSPDRQPSPPRHPGARRQLAHATEALAAWKPGEELWEMVFQLANDKARATGENDLVPNWIAPGPVKVQRHVPRRPYTQEVEAFKRLKRQLDAYRVVFGQPRQEELVTLLDQAGLDVAQMREWAVDLSP